MPNPDENSFRSPESIMLLMKVLYVVVLFVAGFGLLLKFIGYPGESIKLRKFPYPYKAGLAICSDANGTDSLIEFLAIQYYLCTRESTPWGEGLGLEIGNSFWFYDFSGKSSFTVFDTTGNLNSVEASVITQFIEAGYIDALNTYGNFPGRAFDLALAESTLVFLQRNTLNVPVWVINENDSERKYPHDWILADTSAAGDSLITANLIHNTGIMYVDNNCLTHVVGQQSKMSMIDWLKMSYEFFRSTWLYLKKTGKSIKKDNNLTSIWEAADGCTYVRFIRFINHDGRIPRTGVDAGYLAHQLRKENIENLINHNGYTILFTQLGENQSYSELIPQNSREALENVAEKFTDGQLLVTTTSRLLNFNLVYNHLKWNWKKTGEYYDIFIEGIDIPVNSVDNILPEFYQGLTFYTPDAERTRIFLNNDIILHLEINPPDYSGISSVSIPWKWLEFPKAIDFSN